MSWTISGTDSVCFKFLDPVIQMFTGRVQANPMREHLQSRSTLVPTTGPMVSVEMVPSTPWMRKLLKNVNRLRGLSHGWDGPESLPIDNSLLNLAATLIRTALSSLGSSAQAPFVVPLATGDIQVEWHVLRGELEFELRSDGDASIWVRDHGTDNEFEEEGFKAINLFMLWAPRLAAEHFDGTDVSATSNASIFAVAA
ncbi:hypothetical protein ACOSOMT5_P0838 [Acidiphilium sp. MT5]